MGEVNIKADIKEKRGRGQMAMSPAEQGMVVTAGRSLQARGSGEDGAEVSRKKMKKIRTVCNRWRAGRGERGIMDPIIYCNRRTNGSMSHAKLVKF